MEFFVFRNSYIRDGWISFVNRYYRTQLKRGKVSIPFNVHPKLSREIYLHVFSPDVSSNEILQSLRLQNRYNLKV